MSYLSPVPHVGEDPVQDAFLTKLLRNFIHGVNHYLDQGGREETLNAITARVSLAVAVLLILWEPQRKMPGTFGLLMAMGRKLWSYRRWIL